MTRAARLMIIGGLVAALAAGCATTDPSGDIRASAQKVTDRTGVDTSWPGPGQRGDGNALWDARSDLVARQAVRLALMGNPSVRADLAAIAAARAEFAQAHLPTNPVANVMAGWNVDSAGGMLTAGVMQSLSSLWLLPARKRAARARLQQAVLETADNAIGLAADVEQSHRRIVYYQKLLPVLEERRRLLSLACTAADAKLKAGLGLSLESNRLRTARMEVEAELRAARSDLETEKRKLLAMIDLADGPTGWSAEAGAEDANGAPDEDALVALARKNRLDLLAAGWSVRARQAEFRKAELEAYPDTGIGIGGEREVPADGKTMNKLGPAVRVELPIFDQGQAQVAKAKAELEQARMAARAADQQATLEVRRAREALATAAAQCEAYRDEIIPLARRNVADAQTALDTGAVDSLVLLEAQREVTRVEALLLTYRMQRDLARIDLARAVGGRMILETRGEVD